VCLKDWSNRYFNGIAYKKPHKKKMPLPLKFIGVDSLIKIRNNNPEKTAVKADTDNNVFIAGAFFREHK